MHIICPCVAGIPSRRNREYVKQPSPRQSHTGNPVYRVRTFSNSQADPADTDNSQPLNGKQPGVLNVDAAPSVRRTLMLDVWCYITTVRCFPAWQLGGPLL